MAHEDLANASRAGEGDLLHLGTLAQLFSDIRDVLVGEDDVDDSVGNAGATTEFGNGEGSVGGLRVGFDLSS